MTKRETEEIKRSILSQLRKNQKLDRADSISVARYRQKPEHADFINQIESLQKMSRREKAEELWKR